MDTIINTVGDLLPYHILSYGTLLGSQLFQSFVNTKVCYQVLPRREFLLLQKKIFPVYFGSQIGLAVLTAVTHPPFSLLSLVKDIPGTISLVVVVAMGSLNYYMFGPRTTTAAFVRRQVHDSNEASSGSVNAERTHRVNRSFSVSHAMSIHLNAISLVATVFYGFSLASSVLARK